MAPPMALPPRVATSGRHSVAMGKGLTGGVVGQAAMFQVQCKDEEGQNRTKGGDVVVAKVLPPAAVSPAIDCHVIDNRDGTYTCTYLPVKALKGVDIMVSVNGTRLASAPFKASFESGATEATHCRAYGSNLHHGVTGKPSSFHIQSRDAYANPRSSGGDVFYVQVRNTACFHPEHSVYMKKWSTEATLVDKANGTYEVQWTTNFPGWYSVEVSMDRVPILGSPFKVCVLAESARVPAGIAHRPVFCTDDTRAEDMPPPVSRAHTTLADDVIVVRRPVDRSDAAAKPPKHDTFHFFKTRDRRWTSRQMKGPLLPNATTLAAVDETVYMFLQTAGPAKPIDAVFSTDLDAMRVTGELRRHKVHAKGTPPAATAGMQTAVMRRGDRPATIWFVGGKDATGRLGDVHAFNTADLAWSCAHSALHGPRAAGEAMMKRENHSVVAFREGLWIFGGRSDVGLLDDLHCLDTAEDRHEWKAPATTGDPPGARECHSAVVVEPTGFMLVVGGLDETGALVDSALVLNLFSLSWTKLAQGMVPRHSILCACVTGELFTLGGLDPKGVPSDQLLSVDLSTFDQKGCLDLNADPTRYVAIKGQGGTLGTLREQFTIEAWVLARSFPPYATILSKSDNGWKTGFGLAKYGAGKGDLEEVPQVNFWVTPGYATTKVQAQIEPGMWHHIAGTFDGVTMRILVNGTVHDQLEHKVDKEEEIEAIHYPKADLCIGAHPNKAAWDGMIDEVRVWNCHRTDVQIRESMHETLKPMTPGLIGQWTFNEGAGDFCVDSSGMRNHGTIENGVVRIPSTRSDKHDPNRKLTAAEKRIEDAIEALNQWKTKFEKEHHRKPTKSDYILAPNDITRLARQIGELDVH